MSEELFAEIGLYVGLTLLIGWMCYIMYKLGQESKAGKFGSIMIFVALGVGVLGFVLKGVIKLYLGAEVE